MELSEIQKAVLLSIWYKSGDWQVPAKLAPLVNLNAVEVALSASGLKREGLLESKTNQIRKPGARWDQRVTVTKYRLTKKGREAVLGLLGVVDQTERAAKL
jgi:hypothetical protein